MTEEPKEVTVEQLDRLVEELAKKRDEIEAAEAVTTGLNKELGRIQIRIAEYLRALGREKYASPVGTVSLVQSFQVVNPKTEEDKAALFEWMRERGIYDRYATVHATALKSLFLAEREAYIKEGGDPMIFSLPGMAPATVFESTKFIKSRKS